MAQPFVADHSFLRPFLVTRCVRIARHVLNGPLHLPPAIYDPVHDDERPETQRSEIRRGLDHWRRKLTAATPGSTAHTHTEQMVQSFSEIVDLVSAGDAAPIQLTDAEIALLGQLTDKGWLRRQHFSGLIHSGEAMALAVALERGWGLAADDNAALELLELLSPGHSTMRVRRCLLTAVDEGFVSSQEARSLHEEMKRLGFRDQGEIECE